jgi:hypothetical protein
MVFGNATGTFFSGEAYQGQEKSFNQVVLVWMKKNEEL